MVESLFEYHVMQVIPVGSKGRIAIKHSNHKHPDGIIQWNKKYGKDKGG